MEWPSASQLRRWKLSHYIVALAGIEVGDELLWGTGFEYTTGASLSPVVAEFCKIPMTYTPGQRAKAHNQSVSSFSLGI